MDSGSPSASARDVEEIRTRTSQQGFGGLWRCVADAIFRAKSAIESPEKQAKDRADPELPQADQEHCAQGRTLLDERGAQRPSVFEEVERMVGVQLAACLGLDRARLRSSDLSADIERFLDAVRAERVGMHAPRLRR